MATEYKNLGNVGYVRDDIGVYTFQVGNATSANNLSLVIDPNNNLPQGPVLLQVDKHSVLVKGELNNRDDVIEVSFEQNRLLPELIEKQVRIMYGRGPHVYKKAFKDNKIVKEWQQESIIYDWLEEFDDYGLDDYKDAAKKFIRRFYYFEELYAKIINRTSRLFTPEQRQRLKLKPPVIGFEYVENKRCRLASSKKLNIYGDDIEEQDFNKIFVGNWTFGMWRKFKKYKKLKANNILTASVGISHHKNDTVGKIYGINKFFEGIKDWIHGSNLTPKNINSFIKNSLAAKVHIVVPNEWCDLKRDMLTKYCEENARRKEEDPNKTLISIKLNDGKILELETSYHEGLFAQYFKNEVEKCVRFLSGPENQGKAHATISFKDDKGNDTQWKFESIDLKYKEYIDSMIDYDKRADDVLIASKGLPANISNIDKDGVISKSGSDLLYNYIIYLHTLTMAEEICMQPFNLALKTNFPDLYKQGYRIGLYNDIPQRQEDTAPANRLSKQEI